MCVFEGCEPQKSASGDTSRAYARLFRLPAQAQCSTRTTQKSKDLLPGTNLPSCGPWLRWMERWLFPLLQYVLMNLVGQEAGRRNKVASALFSPPRVGVGSPGCQGARNAASEKMPSTVTLEASGRASSMPGARRGPVGSAWAGDWRWEEMMGSRVGREGESVGRLFGSRSVFSVVLPHLKGS